MSVVVPATGDVIVDLGSLGQGSPVGPQPVFATNDGATSYVPVSIAGGTPGVRTRFDFPNAVPPPGPIDMSVRIAANWTGHALAWGEFRLHVGSAPASSGAGSFEIAHLIQTGNPHFQGFTQPGWVEVDYPLTKLDTDDDLRIYLTGYAPAPYLIGTLSYQVGAVFGDGTYTFDVTYVALVLKGGIPPLRQRQTTTGTHSLTIPALRQRQDPAEGTPLRQRQKGT